MKNICQTLLALLLAIPLSLSTHADDAAKIRIGTYDSRAIAIAFTPSKFNSLGEQMQAYKKAKADGDQKRVQELEALGQKLQRKIHRQGFSLVPVQDLLKHVEDKLPEVARSAKVVAIVRACDFTADNVEVVDVTDELVQLFDPSEKTLGHVRGIRTKPPLDLDDMEFKHQH